MCRIAATVCMTLGLVSFSSAHADSHLKTKDEPKPQLCEMAGNVYHVKQDEQKTSDGRLKAVKFIVTKKDRIDVIAQSKNKCVAEFEIEKNGEITVYQELFDNEGDDTYEPNNLKRKFESEHLAKLADDLSYRSPEELQRRVSTPLRSQLLEYFETKRDEYDALQNKTYDAIVEAREWSYLAQQENSTEETQQTALLKQQNAKFLTEQVQNLAPNYAGFENRLRALYLPADSPDLLDASENANFYYNPYGTRQYAFETEQTPVSPFAPYGSPQAPAVTPQDPQSWTDNAWKWTTDTLIQARDSAIQALGLSEFWENYDKTGVAPLGEIKVDPSEYDAVPVPSGGETVLSLDAMDEASYQQYIEWDKYATRLVSEQLAAYPPDFAQWQVGNPEAVAAIEDVAITELEQQLEQEANLNAYIEAWQQGEEDAVAWWQQFGADEAAAVEKGVEMELNMKEIIENQIKTNEAGEAAQLVMIDEWNLQQIAAQEQQAFSDQYLAAIQAMEKAQQEALNTAQKDWLNTPTLEVAQNGILPESGLCNWWWYYNSSASCGLLDPFAGWQGIQSAWDLEQELAPWRVTDWDKSPPVSDVVAQLQATQQVNLTADTVPFEYNSWTLPSDEKTRKNLGNIIEYLKQPSNNDKQFYIGGHASAQGSWAYNLYLSGKRAQALVNYLVNNSDGALTHDRFLVVPLGEFYANQSFNPNSAEHQRVHLMVLSPFGVASTF